MEVCLEWQCHSMCRNSFPHRNATIHLREFDYVTHFIWILSAFTRIDRPSHHRHWAWDVSFVVLIQAVRLVWLISIIDHWSSQILFLNQNRKLVSKISMIMWDSSMKVNLCASQKWIKLIKSSWYADEYNIQCTHACVRACVAACMRAYNNRWKTQSTRRYQAKF